MCLLYLIIGTALPFLATCNGIPKCINGTIVEENATALIDIINEARRKLADGLQTTENGALLPPAKDMNVLQWDCEVEENLIERTSKACNGLDYDDNFFWFTCFSESFDILFAYTKECLAKVENKAPTNITSEAVYFFDENNGDWYELWEYSHLIRPSTRSFACIRVDGYCSGYRSPIFCATEQETLENGDIVYEIAEATTSAATTVNATTSVVTTANATASVTTTVNATTSVATTANATASVATTAKATTNIATTVTSLESVATSSTPTLPKHITECASAPTTSSCITQSPKRVRREAKASLFQNFLRTNQLHQKRGGKTHRKQLRNTPMTLTAHRTHAAKTATGDN